MRNFWLATVPRVVLGLTFLAGAIDGFSFIGAVDAPQAARR